MDKGAERRERFAAIRESVRLAERVALLYGWSPVRVNEHDMSPREKALYVVWRDWCRAYKAAGGSLFPIDHPELSDDEIDALARRRWEGVGPY